MTDVVYRVHAFAPAATPIILYGESGVGKTFWAKYIHDISERAGGFHAFSVGTVAPQLALDELFGHVPGAFTDAHKSRPGRIAVAGGGTLLLDDMQNLDLDVQKQLLQVLDQGSYSAVGSDRVLAIACRIIFAMTEAPDVLMRRGQLLRDLRFRFGACAIRIPALRERRLEIPLLAQQSLERCERRTRIAGPTRVSQHALDALRDGEYEGNVRQLSAAVEYGYLMARMAGCSEIGVEHLPEEVCPLLRYQRHGDPKVNLIAVERALVKTAGNVKQAAKLLEISRSALNSLLAAQRAVVARTSTTRQ